MNKFVQITVVGKMNRNFLQQILLTIIVKQKLIKNSVAKIIICMSQNTDKLNISINNMNVEINE